MGDIFFKVVSAGNENRTRNQVHPKRSFFKETKQIFSVNVLIATYMQTILQVYEQVYAGV